MSFCESLTCFVGRRHGCYQVWSREKMCFRQREEVDCVADGVTQHHLEDVHRWHVLVGWQDHCCYTYTKQNIKHLLQLHIDCLEVLVTCRYFMCVWVLIPAAWAAAWEVPLREVKQVLQSLLALTMSSPGANKSTHRPKLVPPAPCDMSWSAEFTAPTVMTYA